MSFPGFAAAERAWENKDDGPEADAGLWIVACLECDWQATDRDEWRAEHKAAGHYLDTEHIAAMTLEDR